MTEARTTEQQRALYRALVDGIRDDTILRELNLVPMTLDGRPVAVVMRTVRHRLTGAVQGYTPVAVVMDPDLSRALSRPDTPPPPDPPEAATHAVRCVRCRRVLAASGTPTRDWEGACLDDPDGIHRVRCGDCAALPGQAHQDGCDVARCTVCGWQRIGHDGHDDGWGQVWTGEWPGTAEVRAGLGKDLNDLAARAANGMLTWDRDAQQWTAP